MPRYDFECEDEHVTERTYAFGEAPSEMMCPDGMYPDMAICGKKAVRRFNIPLTTINNKVMLPPSKRRRGKGGN